MEKIALITGVTGALGAQLAHNLLLEGWFVIGVARNPDLLKKLHETFGEKFIPKVCDVTDLESIHTMRDELVSQNKIPSLFLLNAGSGSSEEKNHIDLELHKNTMDTNYFGILNWVESWISNLQTEGGVFVAISSILAKISTPGSAAYCASKAAIASCFQSLRFLHKSSNIKFMTIFPGPIKSAMLKSDTPIPFAQAPDTVAEKILKAIKKNKRTFVFPLFYRVLFGILRLLPESIASRIIR